MPCSWSLGWLMTGHNANPRLPGALGPALPTMPHGLSQRAVSLRAHMHPAAPEVTRLTAALHMPYDAGFLHRSAADTQTG